MQPRPRRRKGATNENTGHPSLARVSHCGGFEVLGLPKIVSTRVQLLEMKRPGWAPSSEQRLSPAHSVLIILGLSAMSWGFLLCIAMALYAVT